MMDMMLNSMRIKYIHTYLRVGKLVEITSVGEWESEYDTI